MLKYIKPVILQLKHNPQFGGEALIQQLIADDPSVLGLGNLTLVKKEHIQPDGGRLDLLLEDPNANRRYEVEVLLGELDASHLARVMSYWCNESKRAPKIDHVAVIVAENIFSSRYFDVIARWSESNPLIAIELTALEVPCGQTVIFRRVLNLNRKQRDSEYEWLEDPKDNFSEFVRPAVDELQELIAEVTPNVKMNPTKSSYVGTKVDGKSNNILTLRKIRGYMSLGIRLEQSSDLDEVIRKSGVEAAYDSLKNKYRLKLQPNVFQEHRILLQNLIKRSYLQATEKVLLPTGGASSPTENQIDA